METIRVKKTELPVVIPHGKSQEVADVLGVTTKTIKKHLSRGRGLMYERIKKVVLEKYGN